MDATERRRVRTSRVGGWAFVLAVAVAVGPHRAARADEAPTPSEAAARNVPEPMAFDLVRQLDARPGELEVNVLATRRRWRSGASLEWAPEVEWAPVRGFAVELELPVDGRRLEAVKLAAQITLPVRRRGRFAQGVQVAAESMLDGGEVAHGVYVVSLAASRRVGLVGMAGPRLRTGARTPLALLLAGSIFASPRRGPTVGLEVDWASGPGLGELTVLPQVHVPLGSRARLQLGIGADRSGERRRWALDLAARLVVERHAR